MINIFHYSHIFLSDDIKEKIKLKITDIQEVCNWSTINVSNICDKIDTFHLDENNVRNEKIISENIAKLSINFYMDYNFYKKFFLKNESMGSYYDEKMKKLGFKDVDNYWISERKPDLETVVENVFLSCLYRSIEMKMAESYENKCEINSFDEEFQCKSNNCQSSSNDLSNECDEDLSVEDNVSDVAEDSPKTEIVNKPFDFLCQNTDKWLCSSCCLLNTYQYRNCTVCSKERKHNGLWMCHNCTYINKFHSANCSVCETANKELTPSIVPIPPPVNPFLLHRARSMSDLSKEIDFNQWQCWYSSCKRMNSSRYRYCHMCGIDRKGSQCRGDSVQRRTRDGIKDVWICYSCMKINDCEDDICGGISCSDPRFV